MSDRQNVFISWSGKRSRWAAQSLRDWLPLVLQSVKPWMSEEDIQKGSRGLDEIGRALEGIRIGVICLTPDNLSAPWILYEAGALSKTLDAKTRVCTYLLGGLRPQDVKPPLGMFQASVADKDDTRRFVDAINRALDAEPVPKSNLDALFEAVWPLLEKQLAVLPSPDQLIDSTRSLDDMVAEVLDLTRAAANRRKDSEWMEQYAPQLRELFPFLASMLTVARNQWAHPGGGSILSGPLPPPRKIFHLKLKSGEVKDIEGSLLAKVGGGVVFIYDAFGNPTARVEGVEDVTTEQLSDSGVHPATPLNAVPEGKS